MYMNNQIWNRGNRSPQPDAHEKKEMRYGVCGTLRILLVFLVLSLLLSGCSDAGHDSYANLDNEPVSIQTELDFPVMDLDEDLEVAYYYASEFSDRTQVYDSDYLNRFFDSKKIEKQDLIDALNKNNNITDKYKPLVSEYIDLLFDRYPNNNYRVFYENLKGLVVQECTDEFELFEHTWSFDSYACYVAKENTIYTSDKYDYKKGTWEYQIIMHELSHALRLYRNEETGEYVEFLDLNAGDIIIEEALNSYFTVSLFDYEEKDIAYQFQSNMIKLIVESMDNYDLNDYVNHSSSYFADKLDKFTGHHNYAATMFKVIAAQYDDYHSEYINYRQSIFYPLYDWISDIYYKNRFTEDLSYDEKRAVTKELIDKLTYDVPAEYNLDVGYFYQYLDRIVATENH